MQNDIVKITSIDTVTHDVLKIVTEKPSGYSFVPGEAVEISINKNGWTNQLRPFTFTSLPENEYLEFTIKTYPSHKGVTNELLRLKKDDELVLHNVFGAIKYKDEGIFIAGGAGITPFIAIIRELQSKNKIGDNKLIFANKTKSDIILHEEFKKLLGDNFINILSNEKTGEYANGQINEDFIKANMNSIDQYFYVCGPPTMIQAIKKQLIHLNVDEKHIIKEEF